MDNQTSTDRRNFLAQLSGLAGTTWLSAHWPAVAAAAQHAHETMHAATAPKLKVFTPEQAREVEAICACIIPSDEQPGAHEAGVVYFIDYALQTFAADDRKIYDEGLPRIQKLTQQTFPGVKKFSQASAEQQQKILSQFATSERGSGRGLPFGEANEGDPFFNTIWAQTIAGFLVAPEGHGSADYVGWKVIDRDPAMAFQPPFGFYDKDYPGFQAETNAAPDKSTSAKGTGAE